MVPSHIVEVSVDLLHEGNCLWSCVSPFLRQLRTHGRGDRDERTREDISLDLSEVTVPLQAERISASILRSDRVVCRGEDLRDLGERRNHEHEIKKK